MPLACKVVQAAGRGGQDIHALVQGRHLRALAHAAENHKVAQRQAAAIGGEAFVYLQGKLARGCKHQRADVTLCAASGQPVQNGHGEGRRFTRACLGTAQHVAPCQHRPYGLFLNGRGLGVAGLGCGAQNGGAKPKFTELHATFLFR